MGRKSKKMKLPVIMLRGMSVFPSTISHFDIGRERSIAAIEKAMEEDQIVFLVSQKRADVDLPTEDDVFRIGTISRVKQMLRLPGNTVKVLVEGQQRARILNFEEDEPCFIANVERLPEDLHEITQEEEALRRVVFELFERYVQLENRISPEVLLGLEELDDISIFSDLIISYLYLKPLLKQELLEEYLPFERLKLLHVVLLNELEILEIELKIEEEVKNQINHFQKEYYLREQVKAIQKELGEESISDEAEEYAEKLENLEVSDFVREKIQKEIKRYVKLPSMSAESSVLRSYLEMVFDLPWNNRTEDSMNIEKAEHILNEEHYGLLKVKERILEFLAVRQLSTSLKAPIICLVGPPGVGKTSIARSVAHALNREFVRVSLGGVRDEAEIRGHRRTYIGAIPGRVMSSIKDVKVNNPVFLFDEIDKMASDFRGDPASAMLEVLDPEQNKEFTDHYLELPFDLSKVLFITTANSISGIPRPLLDRMELIEVSGYTEEEKICIAQDFLIPKVCKENGLSPKYLKMNEDTLRCVIGGYTRESGVRGLEREIGKLCRKCAVEKVKNSKKRSVTVSLKNVESYLGKIKFRHDVADEEAQIGSVNGMAWTQVGGETLNIEVVCLKGTGKLELTGKLGDVMKESAKAGHSYLRMIAEEYGIESDFYKNFDLHIHIPEGAIPKDGPSAGISMTTAMLSAVAKIPVKPRISMTGEITLRGKVLAVGGIKEKVLAAYRANVREIILPFDNQKDVEEIPVHVREGICFHFVKEMKEVLDIALLQ